MCVFYPHGPEWLHFLKPYFHSPGKRMRKTKVVFKDTLSRNFWVHQENWGKWFLESECNATLQKPARFS
jgi:hypothetical protein